MAWESIAEWKKACEEKIKQLSDRLEEVYKENTEKAEKAENTEKKTLNEAQQMYFLFYYNKMKKHLDINALNKYINIVKEYDTKLSQGPSDTAYIRNFITDVWKNYKEFKQNHDEKIQQYLDIIQKLISSKKKTNNGKNDTEKIKKNLDKEKEKYEEYLNNAKKKIKKNISEIKPKLAQNGIAMLSTLQNVVYIKDEDKNDSSRKKVSLLNLFDKIIDILKYENITKIDISSRPDHSLINSYFDVAYKHAFGRVTILWDEDKTIKGFDDLIFGINSIKQKNSDILCYLKEFIVRSEKRLKEVIFPYYDSLKKDMECEAEKNLKENVTPLSKFDFKTIASYIYRKQKKILNEVESQCIKEYRKNIKKSNDKTTIDKTTIDNLKALIKSVKKVISIEVLSKYNIPKIKKITEAEAIKKGAKIGACIGAIVPGLVGAWIGLKFTATLWATIMNPETFLVVIFSFGIPLLGAILASLLSAGAGAVVGGLIGAAAGAIPGAFFGSLYYKITSGRTIKKFKQRAADRQKMNNFSTDKTDDALPAPPVTPMHGPETPQ